MVEKAKKKTPVKKPYIPQILNRKVMDDYDTDTLDELRKIFVENLKAVQYEWNINRATIARISGVSKTTVSQWFQGSFWPRMGSLMALAKHINRNPTSFFKKDGVHITKDDGGFQADGMSKEGNLDPLGETPAALQNIYYELTLKGGNKQEKEALQKNFVDELGEISDSEKMLIANWRLLSRSSQAYILHTIYLEGRYTKELLRPMHDNLDITSISEKETKEEK